jgi:hypothetical protein
MFRAFGDWSASRETAGDFASKTFPVHVPFTFKSVGSRLGCIPFVLRGFRLPCRLLS